MKIWAGMAGFVAVMFLVGICIQFSSMNSQIRELEKENQRTVRWATNVDQFISGAQTNSEVIIKTLTELLNQTETNRAMQLMSELLTNQVEANQDMKYKIGFLYMELTNHIATGHKFSAITGAYYMRPANTVPETLKDGVPVSIHKRISEEAKRTWPENYEMQLFHIKSQIKAYKDLNR